MKPECKPTGERKYEKRILEDGEVWSAKASCGAYWPCEHVSPVGYKPGEPFK